MSEFPVVPTSNYVNMHNHRSYPLPRCTLTWIPQALHSHGFPKLYTLRLFLWHTYL